MIVTSGAFVQFSTNVFARLDRIDNKLSAIETRLTTVELFQAKMLGGAKVVGYIIAAATAGASVMKFLL